MASTTTDAAFGLTIDLSGIDMNIVANITIYTQLVCFQADFLSEETLFARPDSSQQRIIHELAHRFGLEFEYSISNCTARVTRRTDLTFQPDLDDGFLDVFDFDIASMMPIDTPGFGLERDSPDDLTTQLATPEASQSDHSHQELIAKTAMSTQHSEHAPKSSHKRPYNSYSCLTNLDVTYGSPCKSSKLLSTPSSAMNDSLRFPASPAPSVISSYFTTETDGLHERARINTSASREIAHDSSSWTSMTTGSVSSARRGKMDDVSRAAMKAVKAIGACWRCKVLRKTCDTNNPCSSCPKSTRKSKSNWEAVGCKRGQLKDETLPLRVCASAEIDAKTPNLRYDNVDRTIDQVLASIPSDASLVGILAARQKHIELIAKSECPQQKFFELGTIPGKADPGLCWKPGHTLQWKRLACESCEPFLPLDIGPLDELIIGIMWETSQCCFSQYIFVNNLFGMQPKMWDVAMFLRSAASHQKKNNNNELISLSLKCLQSCLEVLRLKSHGYFEHSHHLGCKSTSCNIHSISSLENHLESYLDELQLCFFTQENIRSKETWWLSAFYSLCIQSVVRRSLLQMEAPREPKPKTWQYLHTACRLFIAISGTYDALMPNCALPKEKNEGAKSTVSFPQNLQIAQHVVKHYRWRIQGIGTSAEYLMHIYEDQRWQTLSSLGWHPGSELLSAYDFVANNGEMAHFELRKDCLASPKMPLRVYLGPKEHAKKTVFYCQYPGGCKWKNRSFKRQADLNRHYQADHALKGKDLGFNCDYRQCSRSISKQPFGRKDKFRDHLRDNHKEYIGSAKGPTWLAERTIHKDWWRCTKCLTRIDVSTCGYGCMNCQITCQEDLVLRMEGVLNQELEGTEPIEYATITDGVPIEMEEASPDVPWANKYSCCGTFYDTGWACANGSGSPCSDCKTINSENGMWTQQTLGFAD